MSKGGDYRPGHPWYYKLGGKVVKPRLILIAVRESGYRGWNTDLQVSPEASLREEREKVIKQLRSDLRHYRKYALKLHTSRREGGKEDPMCSNDIEGNICLKYNHLYNDFAHLLVIDERLSMQGDLFGFG